MGMSDTRLHSPSGLGMPGEASYRPSGVNVRVLGPVEVLSDERRSPGRTEAAHRARTAGRGGRQVRLGRRSDRRRLGRRADGGGALDLADVRLEPQGRDRRRHRPRRRRLSAHRRAGNVDAVEFERAVEETSGLVETAPAAAAQRLRAALALWRGHPYADVPGPASPRSSRRGASRSCASAPSRCGSRRSSCSDATRS